MGSGPGGKAVRSARLFLWIVFTLFRSGILHFNLRHWFGMLRAFWRCGPSFAFLGQLADVRFPGREALVDDEGSLTFGQLRVEADRLARYLRHEAGVEAGQRVAIVFANHRGFVLSLLALTRIGADVLPVNPKLPRGPMSDILNSQRIDLVLHEAEVTEHIDPSRAAVVWQEGLDGRGPLPRVKRAGQLIVLTSGSTGVSKGIVRRPTLGEILPVTAGLLRDLPIALHRRTILAIPFYHGYGIATLAMSLPLGCSLSTGRKYDVSALLARQTTPDPALLVTVPTLLWRWIQHSKDHPSLSAVITGSAPLSAHLCRSLTDRLGPILYNLYGATETGLIALATPAMLSTSPGCVGKPLPGNQVEIEGQIGAIRVRGPLVLGAGTDGWLNTGDLGRFDGNGYLHVCGRADGMIVSGGENVYPHELEDLLAEHPHLKEFSVLPVEDEEFGQRLIAAVVSTGELREADLKDWLAARLERFKLPRRIYFLDSLPRNELGKVRQKDLMTMIGEQG